MDRFEAVAARRNIEFAALFSARTESDRSSIVDESRWHFPHRDLPAVDRGTPALALPTPLLSSQHLYTSRISFWVQLLPGGAAVPHLGGGDL